MKLKIAFIALHLIKPACYERYFSQPEVSGNPISYRFHRDRDMGNRISRESSIPPFEPTDPEFMEGIGNQIGKQGTINFFNYQEEVDDIRGEFTEIQTLRNEEFIVLSTGQCVRLDRVITIFGKPGPSYEKYNHFSNVCFSCFDEGQF